MRRSYLTAVVLFAIGAVSVAFVVPLSAATSIQPPNGPMTITERTFESPGDASGAASYPNIIQNRPTAWWGIRGGVGESGTSGLWCAQELSGISYPNYLRGTSGLYDILLPELSEYYEASVRFWYRYPSRGDADSPAFAFLWTEGSTFGYPQETRSIEGLTSTGVVLEYDLTDPANYYTNLSRRAGGLRWRFVDRNEGPPASVPIYSDVPPYEYLYTVIIYQPVNVGHGPSIDDVVVEGYAFGPVRSLASTPTTGGIELGWERPFAARGAVDLEDREIEYRLWRRPQSADPGDSWVELSQSPLTDASTTVTTLDSGALPGISYAYLVAPYAIGSTTAYGESQGASGRLMGPNLDIAASASPTAIVSGEDVTFTYTATNNGSVALTDVMVEDEWGTVAGPLSIDVDESVQLPLRVRPLTVSRSYLVTASSAAESFESSAASEFVRVLNPSISVAATPVSRHANKGKHADFDVTVTNTSPDSELSDVVIDLGVESAGAGVIAPGGSSVTLRMSVPVASSSTLDVSARGTFLPGREISDNDTLDVDVVLEEPRIAGATRIATAIEASRRLYPSGIMSSNIDGRRVVVVATGYDFPDALSAASLAGAAGGPLLLFRQGDTTSAVLNYIKDELDADYAYVVGGEAVVSDVVISQLRGIGLGAERLSGINRYATAEAVADEVARIQLKKGDSVDTVFLATGLNFPDALAASSLSAAMPAPVLLTKPTSLPSSTDAALRALRPKEVVICGGTGVISSQVKNAIDGNPAYGSPVTQRMPGIDRYETARLINEWGLSNGLAHSAGIDGVFIATGMNYPDALAGGALAGGADGTWRPLMLTRPTALSSDVRALILENEHVSFITVVGGESVVSDAVMLNAQGLFD